jgi:DNA-binding beta-propeller fold protein YncE
MAMSKRIALTAALLCFLPWLLGAKWLITTHSGQDVLQYDDQTKSLTPLVPPGANNLRQPRGLTLGPNNDLLVCSAGSSNWAVLRYDLSGKYLGVAAAGDGLEHPYQSIVGPDGNLYVAGQDNNAVLRYNGQTGESLGVFVSPSEGGLKAIRGIAFHPSGDLLVADRDSEAIRRYDGQTGKSKGDFVPKKGDKLDRPIQLRYGPDGDLYVSSSRSHTIVRFDGQTGEYLDTFVKHKRGGLNRPSGFAWGPDGDLYVASRGSDEILRYDGQTGKFKERLITGKDHKEVHEPEFLLRVPE